VPSKTKPLSDKQLRGHEATRDLAAGLLESVRQMKAGKTPAVLSPAVEARERALQRAVSNQLTTTIQMRKSKET